MKDCANAKNFELELLLDDNPVRLQHDT